MPCDLVIPEDTIRETPDGVLEAWNGSCWLPVYPEKSELQVFSEKLDGVIAQLVDLQARVQRYIRWQGVYK